MYLTKMLYSAKSGLCDAMQIAMYVMILMYVCLFVTPVHISLDNTEQSVITLQC